MRPVYKQWCKERSGERFKCIYESDVLVFIYGVANSSHTLSPFTLISSAGPVSIRYSNIVYHQHSVMS